MTTKIQTPAGFTVSFFPQDYSMVEDFIWGYLYDNGLQSFAPYSLVATKEIVLIYEKGSEI